MQPQPYPILEFDDTTEPVVAYTHSMTPEQRNGPEHGILCFFGEVLTTVIEQHPAEVVYTLRGESGHRPVYRVELNGQPLLLAQAIVGAPMAAVQLERMIALGGRKFVACGGAGALTPETAVGHLTVPTSAVRDEGTSYHYLPPSREVAASAAGVAAIEATLQAHAVPYTRSKTWTTDAVFRETRAKIEQRRAEGCLTVDMEASAWFAVAQHHGVDFAQILYCGDDLSGDEWDRRAWDSHQSIRERIFWLTVEAVQRL